MMKIHRHVVPLLMAPPRMGPTSRASELTTDSCETYLE